MPLTTFDSTKESLQDLLKSVGQGVTQLPDFQRGWVWDDEHVRSLLASVSQSFPIGAVMMLQTGGDGVRFQVRPVEGVSGAADLKPPERLILDGQQRLTSLFQALASGKPVRTRDARKNEIERWYYLDIRKALAPNAEREDAVTAVPGSRQVVDFRGAITQDLSTEARECAEEMFPLAIVFDTSRLTDWQLAYTSPDDVPSKERVSRWKALVESVIKPIQQYQLPLITLRKETPREAVCLVFEKVNTGGVSLNVFELLTASYAIDRFNLRADWEKRRHALAKQAVLAEVESTVLLQAITLLASHARQREKVKQGGSSSEAPVTCKKRDVLKLTLADYQAQVELAQEGFKHAAKLLHGQAFYRARDLPYGTQLVPLAALLAIIGDRLDDTGRRKLLRWFWCGVLGELYGGTTETRLADDVAQGWAWLGGLGPEPSTVREAIFQSQRLLTLRTRGSAAYKGVYALLLAGGAADLLSGEPIDVRSYFDDRIDVHHIFPKAWCKKQGIPRERYDSIVNKTPLSAKTNRIIGGKAPSTYLPALEKAGSLRSARLDELLRTHAIDPALLRGDDFDAFFDARSMALCDRIEKAMGKAVHKATKAAGGV